MKMLTKIYHKFMHDPLYRSSILQIVSTFVLAVMGFVFWKIATKLFDSNLVGIAASLISAMTLVSGLSNLGMNMSLMRYLPKSKKRNEIISSSFIVTGLASAIAAGIFIWTLKFLSPELLFLKSHLIYTITFVIFAIATTWNSLVESVFIAYRASGNILVKNIVLSSLKLILPFLLLSLGAYGIFSSVSLAIFVSSLFAIAVLIYKYNFLPKPVVNFQALSDMSKFSAGNYIAGLLYQAPLLLLPIFVLNVLKPSAAAYYYIDSMIVNFLIIIPTAVTQSLLTEGSYDGTRMRDHLLKSIEILLLLLIPAVFVIFFLGNFILHFFGSSYEFHAFGLLRILSISVFFTSLYFIGSTIMRIKHRIKTLIFSNLVGLMLVLGFSYLFLPGGLTSLGLGFLIGQVATGLMFLGLTWREIFRG